MISCFLALNEFNGSTKQLFADEQSKKLFVYLKLFRLRKHDVSSMMSQSTLPFIDIYCYTWEMIIKTIFILLFKEDKETGDSIT